MTNTCMTALSSTKTFLQQNFMTAKRIPPSLVKGINVFDVNSHKAGGYRLATLDKPGDFGKIERPLMGHWVPQGDYCDIPVNPGATGYVFTPDFSGCSILIDQLDELTYRVFHVQGGSDYLSKEYLSRADGHGLGLATAMTFDDYGEAAYPRGFAFMKFEEERWWIYFQRQNGVGLNFANGQFAMVGAQTVRGGGRIPVPNLKREPPRKGVMHSGKAVPTPASQLAELEIEVW